MVIMKLQTRQQRQNKSPKILYHLRTTLIPVLCRSDIRPNQYGQYTLILFGPINEVDVFNVIMKN
jgi:hypothetical protein